MPEPCFPCSLAAFPCFCFASASIQRRRRPAADAVAVAPGHGRTAADRFPLLASSAAARSPSPRCSVLFSHRSQPETFRRHRRLAAAAAAAANPSHHRPGPHLYLVKAIGKGENKNPNPMVFHLKLLSVKFSIQLSC